MLSLRIVAGGAVFLLVSAAAVGGVAAQTETTETPGKPLELLRIIEAPERPTAVAHSRIHTATHRWIAARKRHSFIAKVQPSKPTVQDMAASTLRPEDADMAAPASVATADQASQPVPPPGDPAMGPLVVGNQTVDVASQSDLNALDLAADAAAKESANAPQSNALLENTKPNDAAPGDTTAAVPAPAVAVVSDVASKSDSIKAAPASAPQPQAAASAVGSPSWIAQVMAAAAGAVAAGSLAWFLIGSAPQRTYG
jgi:hypothetical protein